MRFITEERKSSPLSITSESSSKHEIPSWCTDDEWGQEKGDTKIRANFIETRKTIMIQKSRRESYLTKRGEIDKIISQDHSSCLPYPSLTPSLASCAKPIYSGCLSLNLLTQQRLRAKAEKGRKECKSWRMDRSQILSFRHDTAATHVSSHISAKSNQLKFLAGMKRGSWGPTPPSLRN